MNLDANDRFLDEVEDALERMSAQGRRSETSFLQTLLLGCNNRVSAAGISPADLYRAIRYNRPLMRTMQSVVELIAMPAQQPRDALRPGDWILRAVPGTGDIGHVSVLTSGDLLKPSVLAAEDIAAESTQPGYYGLVLEAGAFPHSRSRPFARRVLDSRGLVPPHTVILRPKYSQAVADFPPDEPELDFEDASPAADTVNEPRIDPRDERVDVSAKFALQRMMKRSDMRNDAVRLIDGINSGNLAGIFGDDLLATVRLAQRHGTQRWLLVPKGEDAALVLDPAEPLTASPTIVFRRLTRNTMPGKAIDPKTAEPVRSGQEFGVRDPQTGQQVMTRDLPRERLDAALQKASRTFDLWQNRQLAPCASSTSATPVPNLVPPSFCESRRSELLVVVTTSGTSTDQLPIPAANVVVEVVGPSPSTTSVKLTTDTLGQARFQDLPPGSFQVTARKEGFDEAKTQVVLAGNQQQPAEFLGEGEPTPSGAKVVQLQLAPSTFPGIEAFIALDRSKGPPPTFVGPNTKIKWEDVQFQWKLKGQFSETKLFLTVRHKTTGHQFFQRKIRDKNDVPPRPLAPVDNQTATSLPSTPLGVIECELEMKNLAGASVDKKKLRLTLVDQLVICDAADVPLFDPQTFVIGERVNLKVRTEPTSKPLTDIEWTIPGRRIREYDIKWNLDTSKPVNAQVETHGRVEPIATTDLRRASLKFIWTESLSKTDVVVTANQSGVSMSARLAVTVLAPQMGKYESITNDVKVINLTLQGASRVNLSPGEHLALIGEPLAPLPGAQVAGIAYTANVSAPNGVDGELGYIQLVKTRTLAKSSDGSETTIGSGSEFVLDDKLQKDSGVNNSDNFFYPRDSGLLTSPISSGQSASPSREDTPGEQLNAKLFNEVTRSDEFRTYLMFRSNKPKSVPISLGRLDWHWKGTAQLAKKRWQPKPGSFGHSANPKGVQRATLPEKERFPEWEKSVTN